MVFNLLIYFIALRSSHKPFELLDPEFIPRRCTNLFIPLDNFQTKVIEAEKGEIFCINTTGSVLYAFGHKLKMSGYQYNKKSQKTIKRAFASTLAYTEVSATKEGPITLIKIPVNRSSDKSTKNLHLLKSKWKGKIHSKYSISNTIFKSESCSYSQQTFLSIINPLYSEVTFNSKAATLIELEGNQSTVIQGKGLEEGKFITLTPVAANTRKGQMNGKHKIATTVNVDSLNTPGHFPEELI